MIEPTPAPQTPQASVLQAVLIVVALVPLLGALIAMGTMIGVANFLFAGYIFLLYWTGMKAMAPAEFLPALVGALGGLGLAYLVHELPVAFGVPGFAVAMAGVAGSIYLLIRGQAAVLVNYAFMLLLTIGTCAAFTTDADYAAAAAAIVLAALYSGGIVLLGMTIMSRKAKAAGARLPTDTMP